MSHVEKGDTVRCNTDRYRSIHRGETRVVLNDPEDYNGNYVLRNDLSPIDTSVYDWRYFTLVAKRQPKEKENPTMLHIAVLLAEEFDFTPSMVAMAVWFNDHDAAKRSDCFMADTKPEALKQRVRMRIERNPNEKWLILSGNTVAEKIPEPKVRFRQV